MQEIVEFIASQLKDQYNLALAFIEEKRYDEAQVAYENAAALSEVAGYQDGIRMSMISIANLKILQAKYWEAFQYAELAQKNTEQNEEAEKEVQVLLSKLAMELLKEGIEMEKRREYGEAYSVFAAIIPYLNTKRQEVVKKELTVLERYQKLEKTEESQ